MLLLFIRIVGVLCAFSNGLRNFNESNPFEQGLSVLDPGTAASWNTEFAGLVGNRPEGVGGKRPDPSPMVSLEWEVSQPE